MVSRGRDDDPEGMSAALEYLLTGEGELAPEPRSIKEETLEVRGHCGKGLVGGARSAVGTTVIQAAVDQRASDSSPLFSLALQALRLLTEGARYDVLGNLCHMTAAIRKRDGFMALTRGLERVGESGVLPLLNSTLLLDPREMAVTVPVLVWLQLRVPGLGPLNTHFHLAAGACKCPSYPHRAAAVVYQGGVHPDV